jgi:hypothetical protein
MRRILALSIPIAALAVFTSPAYATTQTVDETATGYSYIGESTLTLEGTVTGTPIANGEFYAQYTQSGDATENARCGASFPVVGDVTLTGRGGAELVKRERGTFCEATGVITGTWNARPNQSTGRFAGATGNGTFRVTFNGSPETALISPEFRSTETGTLFPVKSP